jgi:uncharacterized protein (TIGR03067 family)
MTWRVCVALVGALVLVAADDPKKEAPGKDREKLQGAWVVVAWEHDGKALSEQAIKTCQVTVTGDKWVLKTPGPSVEFQFELDPAARPKALDKWIPREGEARQVLPGIYEVDGDTLKHCWTDPGQERPKEFTTKKGTGTNLMVFKREKPKAK